MTISGTYTQSYSFSLTLATVRTGTAPTAPTGEATAVSANQPLSQSGDTVTVSPEATTPSPAPAAQPSRSAQKVDALLAALDADDDGTITKDEFTHGAMALLGRRRGADDSERADGESGDRVRGHHHRSHRLERRLEKLFDRVDADNDGAVNASELTDALASVYERRAKKHAGGEAPQEPAQPIAASASYTSVTVVAVAVKQYAAISAAA